MANKEQKEGIARLCDTIAVTALITVAASVAGYGGISTRDAILLGLMIPCLLAFTWYIRRTS